MKYIKYFDDLNDANMQGENGLFSPHLSLISGFDKKSVNFFKNSTKKFTCEFDSSGKIKNIVPIEGSSTYFSTSQTEIYYRTTDKNILNVNSSTFGGANIKKNIYNASEDIGVIILEENITDLTPQSLYGISNLKEIISTNSDNNTNN